MSGSADSDPAGPADLQREVEKRKTWFYECQLRWLNLGQFRGVNEAVPDPRLDLISEPLLPAGQMGGQMKSLGQVYLDDQEPVWTPDELARREAFADGFIGRTNNWLGYKRGKRLADKLSDLKKKYEASVYSSQTDLDPGLNKFGRKDTGTDANSMGRALSRAVLAEAKPWLIPELYNGKNIDSGPIDKWIENLEAFVGDVEAELGIAVGGTPGQPVQADPPDAGAYRAWIKSLIESSSTHNTADSLTARMLTQVAKPPDPSVPERLALFEIPYTYKYEISIQTPGYPMALVADFPSSKSVQYWTGVVKNSLGEVYVNKPNADMGLCHIMRTLYLLGTLPASLGSDAELTWRRRTAPDEIFAKFFAKKGEDPALKDNETLRKRFQAAQTKLQVILEETAAHPRSAAPTFSPLAQEVIRQALHSFKFWMDEPLHVSANDRLLSARKETGIVTNKHEQEAEMEYWSENHYIMFASSEFLAGQFWETDQFQPGKEFLAADSKSGILTGKQQSASAQVAEQPAHVRLDGVSLVGLLPRTPVVALESRGFLARPGGARQGGGGDRPVAVRRRAVPAQGDDGGGWRAVPV